MLECAKSKPGVIKSEEENRAWRTDALGCALPLVDEALVFLEWETHSVSMRRQNVVFQRDIKTKGVQKTFKPVIYPGNSF